MSLARSVSELARPGGVRCRWTLVALAVFAACAPARTPEPAPAELAVHVYAPVDERGVAAQLTLLRDDAFAVPLDPRRVRSVAVIGVGPTERGAAGRELAVALKEIFGDVSFFAVDPTYRGASTEPALEAVVRSDATIIASFPYAGKREDTVGAASELVARLSLAAHRAIVVAFADTVVVEAVPRSAALLLAPSEGAAAQLGAARALAGVVSISGRLATSLPGIAAGSGLGRRALSFEFATADPRDVGMSPTLLQQVDSIIEQGLLAGAAPGAAVAIGRRGRIVKLRGYGTLDRRAGFGLASDSTIYDLASLTKVIATTTLAMMLVDEGLLELDAPVARYLPEWRTDGVRSDVTIRHLLRHDSGLPPYSSLYFELQGREAYVRRIGGIALDHAPGSATVYSDFGPILLAVIIERLTGYMLDELFQQRIAGPLGMRETGFNPRGWQAGAPPVAVLAGPDDSGEVRDAPGPLLDRVAPTEIDSAFRRRHVHGWVHDENAYALGGVAGHAGLFGSARDLARFAQMLLDGGFFEGHRYVRPGTIAEFTRRQSDASSRALGWDTPEGTSSAGDFFSAASFGHTGFTGTSIWIDPERDVFVVLLTNRVNPTRTNQRHVALRRAVADAVQGAITDLPLRRRSGA